MPSYYNACFSLYQQTAEPCFLIGDSLQDHIQNRNSYPYMQSYLLTLNAYVKQQYEQHGLRYTQGLSNHTFEVSYVLCTSVLLQCNLYAKYFSHQLGFIVLTSDHLLQPDQIQSTRIAQAISERLIPQCSDSFVNIAPDSILRPSNSALSITPCRIPIFGNSPKPITPSQIRRCNGSTVSVLHKSGPATSGSL